MAISRQEKETQVEDLASKLASAKLTVMAKYTGLSVKDLQGLRRAAREAGVDIKVVKNRLVRIAMARSAHLKEVSTDGLTGQLLYAIGEDEVAPAQLLSKFAKDHEALQMIGGFDSLGNLLAETDIKALASLPTKEQLRSMLVGTIQAPLSGFVNVLAGNVRGVLNVLNARAKALE